MRALTVVASIVVCVLSGCGSEDTKPKVNLAADGFPSGNDTPEGAACDLARAFINRDPGLFTSACLRSYGPAEYARFLADTVAEIETEATKEQPSPEGPKAIGKVFAARRLSLDGPASYGFAAFDFQDVVFVDVGAFLHNDTRWVNRTLVIKDRDGKWYAHPMPSASAGLLAVGLDSESASQVDFRDAYGLSK